MPIHESQLSVSRPQFLGGGQWQLTGLNSINVVLGRNGSGKSQLLRTIRSQDLASRHYVVPERTGEISFEAGFMLEALNANSRQNRSQSNFSASYRQEVVTRIQAYYTKRGTKKVNEINHDPEQLLKSLNLILPDFTTGVKSENPFYDLRRVKDGTSVSSVNNLSSGESQLLSLGLDILTITGIWELDAQAKRFILLDEPDAHIHPDLQIKFADFICYISREFEVQFVVATHSTTLLSALGHFGKEEVSLFYLDPDKLLLSGELVNQVNRELAAVLGGHLVMGPLFAAPVLLVEGDDDYRVWVQVVRSGKVNVCVLPCNGEEIRRYQKTLERMFAALSEQTSIRGIALLDGDKQLPQPTENNPQTYVRFVGLSCHETENLYLTDEVLRELGHTWDTAKEKIKAEAANWRNKKDQLLAIDAVDRKRSDIKQIIGELSEILDPKKLLWSVRLGKNIGRGRPTGMLADFLGNDVMNGVWGVLPPPIPAAAVAGAD